jgi:hypothetical protein
MSPAEALWRVILLRADVVDRYVPLRKEILMPAEQFVHDADADARCEADFLIQFDVYV